MTMHLFKRSCFIMLMAGLLSALIFTSCTRQKNNGDLATFDGGSVDQQEYFDHFLKSTMYKTSVMPSVENLQQIVLDRAMEKIAVLEATARNFDKDSTITMQIKKTLDMKLAQQYMQKNVVNKVVNDSLVKEFYDSFSPQFHLRYILRVISDSSPATSAKTQLDTINIVYKLLRKGQSFEALAKEYSQDMASKPKGGDLGFVIKESLGDPALRQALQTLSEQSYSKPIKGLAGYYILYKGEKRDVPLPDFDKVKGRIWQTLYRTRRHDIDKEAQKLFKKLAPGFHMETHQAAIDEILKKAHAGFDNAGNEFHLDRGLLSEKEMGYVLVSCDSGQVAAGDLFGDPKKAPTDRWEFNKRLDLLSQQMIFAQQARKEGDAELDEFVKFRDDILSALLRQKIYQLEVKSLVNAKIDSMQENEKSTLSAHDLHLKVVEQNSKLEKQYRSEFENRMKAKYHFAFIKKNFTLALKKAEKMKKAQNDARKKEAPMPK